MHPNQFSLPDQPYAIILVSADTEWQAICDLVPHARMQDSPLGEWFMEQVHTEKDTQPVIYFHGGWGKIAAAASTQYVIDRWKPALLVNLGTCGGFGGEIEREEILLAERTLVYDIIEQMGDFDEAISAYTTQLDLSWLQEPYPQTVRRTLLVSGDRDLVGSELAELKTRYGAVAGDWESGAIAYVATRNEVRCLILRGVSDLVSAAGGEAYGEMSYYRTSTRKIMEKLLDALPAWIMKSLYFLT